MNSNMLQRPEEICALQSDWSVFGFPCLNKTGLVEKKD